MKNIALLFCLAFLLFSCKKDNEDLKELLDVNFQFALNNDFTLPKAANVEKTVPDSTITVTTPSIINTVPDEFKKNKADINKIKSLTIENVQLTIKSPSTQTFSFMKTINIYIGASGKTETLIATKTGINEITPVSNSLQLTAKNADISEYLKGANYYLKVETAIVKTYTTEIKIGSEIKFLVVANPLN